MATLRTAPLRPPRLVQTRWADAEESLSILILPLPPFRGVGEGEGSSERQPPLGSHQQVFQTPGWGGGGGDGECAGERRRKATFALHLLVLQFGEREGGRA